MNHFGKLITSVIVCEGAGIIGSIFTLPSVTGWYATLIKPPFNPPNWIFGPVWTILYLLMGVSLYLIWTNRSAKKNIKKLAYQIFFAQLILNTMWSIIFFGMHSPLMGMIVIVILWMLIIETVRCSAEVNRIASYLLYPYLFWVTFATCLNFAILVLNR